MAEKMQSKKGNPLVMEPVYWFTVIPENTARQASLQRIITLSEKSRNNPRILVHYENDRALFRFLDEQIYPSLIGVTDCASDPEFCDTYIVQYGREVIYCKSHIELFENIFPKGRGRGIKYRDLLSRDENELKIAELIKWSIIVTEGFNDKTISVKTGENQLDLHEKYHTFQKYPRKLKQKYKISTVGRPARIETGLSAEKYEENPNESEPVCSRLFNTGDSLKTSDTAVTFMKDPQCTVKSQFVFSTKQMNKSTNSDIKDLSNGDSVTVTKLLQGLNTENEMKAKPSSIEGIEPVQRTRNCALNSSNHIQEVRGKATNPLSRKNKNTLKKYTRGVCKGQSVLPKRRGRRMEYQDHSRNVRTDTRKEPRQKYELADLDIEALQIGNSVPLLNGETIGPTMIVESYEPEQNGTSQKTRNCTDYSIGRKMTLKANTQVKLKKTFESNKKSRKDPKRTGRKRMRRTLNTMIRPNNTSMAYDESLFKKYRNKKHRLLLMKHGRKNKYQVKYTELVVKVKKSAFKKAPNHCFEKCLNDQEKIKRRQKKPFRQKRWSWNTDENLKQKYMFDEDGSIQSSIKEKGSDRYSKEIIKMLRELTDLLYHERTWKINAYVYPSGRKKPSKASHRRNQQGRTHSSQAQEGIPDQYPTQVSDAATGSLDLPPAELVQTSLGSVFRTVTNNNSVPTTNLMPSVDAERGLVSRIRGQLPESNFSRPQAQPQRPQNADQSSGQRSISDRPSTTEQDPPVALHMEENRRLNAMMRCQECRINLRNILFLPCGHHRLCDSCAENIIICPYCESPIEEKIQTYWAES